MGRELLKPLLRGLFRLLYRVELRGRENLQGLGDRVLIVVNHVSFLDAGLMMAFLEGRPVFAIDSGVAEWWWVRPLRHVADLFPIDPKSPMATKSLLAKVKEGRPCVIFPEGRISVTGALMKIYPGPAWIADKADADIVPVRIAGAELTPFSHLDRGQIRRRLFPKITITITEPRRLAVPAELRGRARRRAASLQLYDIMSDLVFRTQELGNTLIEAILKARRIHGHHYPILEQPGGERLSYDKLLIGATALGRRLAALSEPGERVAVFLPNANATVVTIVALQAFGRVPAMLNFSTGSANMEAALVATEVRTVLTSREFIARAKFESSIEALAKHAQIVWLEDLAKEIGLIERLSAVVRLLGFASRYRALRIGPDDPAVVLFTSGSEGRPKGVVLSHGNLIVNCAQVSARVDFNELDKCFNALPLFHSFGLTGGTLLPMVGGVRIFLYPSPLHYRIVPEMIYDTQATIMFGTNSFLKGYARAADPYDFRSLRYVFAGAEPVQEETRTTWFEKFGIRLLTGYGATETAPVLALNTAMHNKSGTVGRFLPGIEWRLEPVEGIDKGGLLWVKGPNIMLGYLRYEQPGALDPPEDGWYDTGDIVDVDPEGFVVILGRAKRFAKIGGEMVSLSAVESFVGEAVPNQHHAIVAADDPRKGERLVLITDANGVTRQSLAAAARQRGIPELNVPAEVVIVDKLPVLGTGKVDYQALQKLISEKVDA